MGFPWKKKNNEKVNTNAVQWEENPLYEEKGTQQEHQRTSANQMNDFLQDMKNSKTRHHRSFKQFFSKKDSKEYTDVKNALSDVTEYTSRNFINDEETNLHTISQAVKGYQRLIQACDVYLEKKGGNSKSGRARKEKVGQILELALQDHEGLKMLYCSIHNMSKEEQAELKWQDILSEARTANLEVDSLSDFQALGAAMKTGENAGRLIPGKGVFTREQKFRVADLETELQGTEEERGRDNFISIAYNEGHESKFKENFKSETLHQSNRNVATSRVANLLGIGGIVEKSSTIKVKEKNTGKVTKGNLMTLAKGEAGAKIANGEVYENMKKKEMIEERIEDAGNLFAPTVQKELSSLQVLDYICGQSDRHANNFFVEKDQETGQYTHIHGIDNDMSFGTGVDYGALAKATSDYRRKQYMRMVVDGDGNLSIPHMDKQLAKNIANLDEKELRFALEDLLEEDAINAAVKRLKIVKDAIKREANKEDSNVFVENDAGWGMQTHKDFINSTGYMKQMQQNVATQGNEGYYNSVDYLSKSYATYRQNSYYGEYMLNIMGYHMGNRKFERD